MFSIIFGDLFHVVAGTTNIFLFTVECCLIESMHHNCFSIHQLMDIWFISSFHLLRIELLQTDKYLYGHMFLFLFSKYQGVRFWGCIIRVYFTIQEMCQANLSSTNQIFPISSTSFLCSCHILRLVQTI